MEEPKKALLTKRIFKEGGKERVVQASLPLLRALLGEDKDPEGEKSAQD